MTETNFSISDPALQMMQMADIDPRRVNMALNRQLADRGEAVLRPRHLYNVRIRQRTGLPLQFIFRRRHHVLIHIEQREPRYQYIENGRERCVLAFPAQLAATVAAASIGRLLRDLASGPSLLADLPIRSIVQNVDGTEIRLRTRWHRF